VISFAAVCIGTIGIFLPILPTTPFYLLATLCFTKCSTRFNRWFTNTRLYKKHFKNFANNQSMDIKTKLRILFPVSVIIIFITIMSNILIVRIILIVLLLAKYWYFMFVIKTI
jgi:uncharacterized membrane protein YbaN (DUF454 family)